MKKFEDGGVIRELGWVVESRGRGGRKGSLPWGPLSPDGTVLAGSVTGL